ncbi:DUF4240 domain-containing protein [Nocardia sp. NPDC004123]
MLVQEAFSRGMYGREVLPVILQPTQQTRYPADARIHSCHSDTVSFVNSDSFWRIIDAAGTDRAPFAEALVDHLADLAPNEILEYQDHFLNIHDALYRWDVWAAAYLIGDGCSDDGFEDFRAGIIALGKDWTDKVYANPDNLADHPVVIAAAAEYDQDAIADETVLYAAMTAYERGTGEDTFTAAWQQFQATDPDSEPMTATDEDLDFPDMGEPFDFSDHEQMLQRLPRLAALYLHRDS